ncbi:MAG: hypothetical protein EAZ76_14095 [Nostocales cyanobacterium]|nr:MAG: hypothetical protein EAZ87_00900 [Nostocales cyanobacterium]TAF12470.1 MAG: hypothetical protein EAZ76_14095 [Nostocales cyanobacterium]
MIQIIKISSTLFLVTCLVIFSPVMNLASADKLSNLSNLSIGNTRETINISVEKLTPQARQKMQAIRQRRNREIIEILDDTQLQKFSHDLHTGKNLNQALAELELNTEQENLINAIIDFTDFKVQEIAIDNNFLDSRK